MQPAAKTDAESRVSVQRVEAATNDYSNALTPEQGALAKAIGEILADLWIKEQKNGHEQIQPSNRG